MKKLISLLLCCLLMLSLFAACNKEPEAQEHDHDHEHQSEDVQTEAPTEGQSHEEEHHDHNHVNYKGLTSAKATLEDFHTAEGRAEDFSFEAGGVTYYAYNNVTMDTLDFSQVQISFADTYVRISCTKTVDADPEGLCSSWNEYMTGLYGAEMNLTEDGSVVYWADHTGNYATLTQLNETTVQLCFYLVA